jgi:hypothetical protein
MQLARVRRQQIRRQRVDQLERFEQGHIQVRRGKRSRSGGWLAVTDETGPEHVLAFPNSLFSGIAEIEIGCHVGRSLKHRSEPSDNDEFYVFLIKGFKQFLKVGFGHGVSERPFSTLQWPWPFESVSAAVR